MLLPIFISLAFFSSGLDDGSRMIEVGNRTWTGRNEKRSTLSLTFHDVQLPLPTIYLRVVTSLQILNSHVHNLARALLIVPIGY